MSIKENLTNIKFGLPEKVKIVAVSKTKPNEDILLAYETGHKIFGENKVQDLVKKYEDLPKDIEWHFIGHLQTNKVKLIAPFISLVHAVDSLKLLRKLNSEAKKNNRKINCLLQMHIADETTKFGLNKNEIKEILNFDEYKSFNNIQISGLMGMATYTDDKNQIKDEFKFLKTFFDEIKRDFFANSSYFKEISMGMSGDYKIAIKEGSTMVRIGSKIFGLRNY